MLKKLAASLAFAILLLAVSPVAKSDSFTVPVEELLVIVPIATSTGQPLAPAALFNSMGLQFIGTDTDVPPGQMPFSFNIGYAPGVFVTASEEVFGNPNAKILAWSGGDTLLGCAWASAGIDPCPTATVTFGDGIRGSGSLFYNPHFAYVAIDSLTISTPATTPEPSVLVLLGLGLGSIALLRRKFPVCP